MRTQSTYLIWSIRTLVSLAVFCVAIEALTRFGFSHISRIEARISRDHASAMAIRKADKPTVLLLGNSLMLEGIDYTSLRSSLSGQVRIVPFPIEQTQFLDWYYGLRRMFDEGSHPDMVVLCMSVQHLISSRIRGDYSAYYLFRLQDIPQIRRDLQYDLTKTSSLVLSRFSLFYAGRSPLRNFILLHTDTAYAQMLQTATVVAAQFPANNEIERTAGTRLTALRQLCSSHAARFAFLLAPGFGPGEAPVAAGAARSQTDLMVPIHLNALSRDKFRDGFHLNAAGARIFTDKVAGLLRNRLANPKPSWQLVTSPKLREKPNAQGNQEN